MSRTPHHRTLERTLSTLALLIGSALPIVLSWILIDSTNDNAAKQNLLNRVPDYGDLSEDPLDVPAGATTHTAYSYHGTIRLIVEGAWETNGGLCDALYCFPPSGDAWWQPALALDGQALAEAAGWDATNRPPPDPQEHTYTALYNVGTRWRPLTLRNIARTGTLRVTVLQVE